MMEEAIFIAASDMRKSKPLLSKMLFAVLHNYAQHKDIELLITAFRLINSRET